MMVAQTFSDKDCSIIIPGCDLIKVLQPGFVCLLVKDLCGTCDVTWLDLRRCNEYVNVAAQRWDGMQELSQGQGCRLWDKAVEDRHGQSVSSLLQITHD